MNWIFTAALISMFCAESASSQPPSEYAGKAIPDPTATQLAAVAPLTDSSIAALPDNSPLLKIAYAQFFLRDYSSVQPNWIKVVSHDLARRKEGAVPLLLELFRENPGSSFRADFLNKLVTDHPELPKEPFLSATRSLWDEKRNTIELRMCHAIARFLSAFGTAKDRRILLEMNSHPSGAVSWVIEPDIQYFDKRIAKGVTPSIPQKADPSKGQKSNQPRPSNEFKSSETDRPPNGESPSAPWSLMVVLIVVAIGLLWLLLRKTGKAATG